MSSSSSFAARENTVPSHSPSPVPVRRQRFLRFGTGLFLVTVLALTIFGIVEYTALRRTNFDGVGKLSLTDQSVTSANSLPNQRRLQTSSSPPSTPTVPDSPLSSILRFHANDVGLRYTANIPTRLCDCSVGLTFPSLDASFSSSDASSASPLTVTVPVTFSDNGNDVPSQCITLRGSSANTFSVSLTLDGNDRSIPSALAYYFTAPSSSSSSLHGNLACTANLLLMPNVWEPSTTVTYGIVIPPFASSSSSSSSSTSTPDPSTDPSSDSYFVTSNDPNSLIDPSSSSPSSSSSSSATAITSSTFSSLWTGEIDLESIVQSFITNYLADTSIPLTETRLAVAGATFMATTDNGPFAAIQIPNIDWNWTRTPHDSSASDTFSSSSRSPLSSDNRNHIIINGGVNPSMLSDSVDTDGAIKVAIASALKGILPSSMQDWVTSTLGDRDIASSPMNFYMFAIPNEPNMSSFRLPSVARVPTGNSRNGNGHTNNTTHPIVNRTDILRQCFQRLDDQVQKGWNTFTTMLQRKPSETPEPTDSSFPTPNIPSTMPYPVPPPNSPPSSLPPPSIPSNPLACSPVLSWMRNMFTTTTASSSSPSSSNCSSSSWSNPMVNIQITLNTGFGTNSHPRPSASSFPPRRILQTFPSLPTVTTFLTVTLVTPDLLADANNMSAILQARVSLTPSGNASFVSVGLARLLDTRIGIWSSTSRVETHIPTVWRKTVTDATGTILRIEAPRSSTLWSSLECGAASIAIEPVTGTPGTFTLRGYAHLSQLWSCFGYVANEYMIGTYAGKPLAQRPIAIKPDTAIDQPKGAVRIVFPLLGTISLPMGIASRRWLKGRVLLNPLPNEADIEIPSFQSNPDVLPPSALVPHAARLFNNFLVLTDLNCTNPNLYDEPSVDGIAKCTGGVDNSQGKLARAWAVSSHPATNILDLTQYIDLGCATDPSQSPLCTNFETLWRKYGYLGVDGLLLSGECSYGVFNPTTLCLDMSFSSDQYGIFVFGMYGYGKQQSVDIDPWNGPNGAVASKRVTGNFLLRQSNGKPSTLTSAFSGIDSAWYLAWANQGGIASGWSGVKITAVNLYTWVRQYISRTVDANVYGDSLGPVPRVDGKLCYSASVGGFDIRYNRDCVFQAILPWIKLAITTDAKYVRSSMCTSSLSRVLECLGTQTIMYAIAGPVYATHDFVLKNVQNFYYTNTNPFGNGRISNEAGKALGIITSVPANMAYVFTVIPTIFGASWLLGPTVYHLVRYDLGIQRINFRTAVTLQQQSLGSLTFSTSIENFADFNAFEASETFTSANNGTAWIAFHRLLCALHGDDTMPPANRPFDFTAQGQAGVTGNVGIELVGTPLQNVSTDYTINLGSIVYSLDALVTRAGLGMFPGWSTGTGFTKPFTDFFYLVTQTVANDFVFDYGKRTCNRYTILRPVPSATPTPRPLVLPSSTPSSSSLPWHKRTQLLLTLALRISNIPLDTVTNSLPLEVLTALRQDIGCYLGWNRSFVRIVSTYTEATGVRMMYGDTATVNAMVLSNDCVTLTNPNQRMLPSSPSSSSSIELGVTQIEIAVTIPRYTETGLSTGYTENDASVLQSKAIDLLVSASTNNHDGTTNAGNVLSTFATAASTIDARYQAPRMAVSSLYVPIVSTVGANPPPIDPSTGKTDNANGGYSQGQVVGAAIAGIIVTGLVFVAGIYVYNRFRVRTVRSKVTRRGSTKDWHGSASTTDRPIVMSTVPPFTAYGNNGTTVRISV